MNLILLTSRVTDKENPLTWQARIVFWAIRTFATTAFKHIFFDLTVSAIWGDIYHPVGSTPSLAVLCHEEEHIRRAKATWFWQTRYLLFPSFRLAEEILAYQWNYNAGTKIERILDVLVEYYSTGYNIREVAQQIIDSDWNLRDDDFAVLLGFTLRGRTS
jgi:hypothetical protein